ncbi:inositol-triphosphate type 1 protein (macronuclear) [Tetrahymena thermophila SB210]|uniref:Inositol-triphosphate type 1 protein n=1 Tax=Tetrahymena thermophila (strain SB210) TaxID=312017 RepID=I7M475_TETTS|nr:inositol-triphosphate type 1 protein [Tetrahymena thermophila SB210]EAS05098.2 inositol-triphosphate type 1 protein [Tetrahymena thermophila SB210]|eukprot:XP_001025343.2 inositol-triphosphate type 1 protein [Tetrahymena thermophila SB210]
MERYLKYGDYVMLYSAEDPVKFMTARSSQEGEVFFIESQSPILREDISSYPNTSELVFAIYPKQYYEASKQFEKFKMRKGTDFDDVMSIQKGEILKRRMEAEKDLNEKKIQSLHGQPITIGSEVQLFHIYSRSFVKATREKNFFDLSINHGQNDQLVTQQSTVINKRPELSQKIQSQQINPYTPPSNDVKHSRSASTLSTQLFTFAIGPTVESHKDMFSLRLSRQISSSTHFEIRINPYLNFKKEGEKIQYDECVYFYNPKHNSIIQNQGLCEVENTSEGVGLQDNGNNKKKSLFQNQYAHLTKNLRIPFTIEKSKIYKHYYAAHKKNNIHLFGIIFLKSSKYITLPSNYLTKDIAIIVPMKEQSQQTFNPNSLSKENNTKDNANGANREFHNKKQFLQLLFKQAQIMREQEGGGNINQITKGVLDNVNLQNMSPEEKIMVQDQFLQQQNDLSSQSVSRQNQYNKNNNMERIYYGDYVRIKHIKRNDKSTTQLISESNLCGFCPNLLLINDKPHIYHEQYPSSGIFQIVPIDESFFGQPVEFDKQYYGSASFRLRHVNTSRYLKFNRLDNNVTLSETLEKYNSLFKNQPQVPLTKNQSFNRSKNSPRWLNKLLGNSGNGNNSPSIRRSSIRVKQLVEGLNVNKKDFTFTTQEAVAMQDDLQDWYSENADLLIESGSREEKYLLEHNSFCIKDEKLKSFIKVNLNDNEATEIVQGNMIEDDDYIKLMFNNLNPLERKYYPLEISSQNGDFFYFTLCKPNEISDLMILNCHLDQFMNILENPQKCLYSQKFIEKAENNLLNLLMWLCNIHPSDRQKPSLQDLSQPPVHQKQNIFRENGLIELLINIIHLIHQEKLLNNSNMEQNPHIFPFVQTILKLLQNICYKNYANSIYALQWYFLFREIILDENVILDIRFDLFINDLFKITDLNVSYQADFESISSKIQYEDFNINALNLILSFCQYNEYRQKDQEEEMVKTIFNTKENIFRRLVLKPNKNVCIEIDTQGFEYVIDPLLEANEREVWDYSIAVVNLMVELCKANVSLVIDQVEYFYPFNAITQIIQNQSLSCSYRSTILTLIKESYMRFDFRDSIASKFPDYIKFRQKNLEIKDQRKISQIVQSRYFSLSDVDFNLKNFIQEEIRLMNKLIKSPIQDKELFELYKLGKIILQMQLFLVERQIYDLKELEEIKTDIQNLLETLINVYENEFKKAKKDDREKIGGLFVRKGYTIQSAEQTEWIISALQSLQQIEYRKQNELLELLYQSPQTSGYFDSANNQLHSTEALEALQEFARSQIEIEKCENLAKNLTKLLLFNDIQIKALAVQNIYTIYSRNLNFYTSVNIIQPIDGKNFGLYQKFQQIHDQIHHYVINLKYVLSNEDEKKNFYLEQLQKVFDELCDELFISQHQIDSQQHNKNSKCNIFDKEKANIESNNEVDPIISQDQAKLIKNSGSKLKGMTKSGFKEQKQEIQTEQQPQYYHVWGNYYVDLNQIQKYQTLMANMNYHKKLLDLIDFFYSQVPMMKGKEHVKLQISQHCVAILIHFIIKNQSNQDLLLSDSRLSGISQEQEESVKSIAYRIIQNDSAIQQLFFVLLYQIYKNNYAELMNFTSSKSTMKSILLEVMKSIKDKIPDDKTYSIYFFDILKYFFSINGKNITQNILLIIQEISEKIPAFSYVIKTICDSVSHLPTRNFEDDIQEEIQNKDESDDENNELKEKEDSKNQEKQEKKIRIKCEENACILITFLRTLKEMVKKSSSQIYTFVRGIFSIKQIKEYLSKTQYLYPLKLEYLKFLMETYINSKQMEAQEYIEVSEIVNLLAHELFNYLEMTQKKELYGKLQLYSRFRSIFEEKYGYSTHQLVQVTLLESFEVYIIQGIIPTIKGFVDKISSTPSDNDAKLVDILLEGLKRIHEYWDNTDVYWTQANKEEFNELKKQIGINAKQFTTPSRPRGSREKTRKNSGKKRTFIGGLFGSSNKEKEKDPKSMQLDFNFADKQDIITKKLKNIKELQDELSYLIQEKGQVFSQKANKSTNKSQQNKMKNQKKQQIFNPKIISRYHDLEIDNLVSIYIQMKKEKPEEFRKILQSLIDVLTKYTGKKEEAMGIRLNAMKMLRKISNYKKDQKISDSIQRDLNAMGFLNFLCDVIVEEDDSKMKLEYILGLNNFMEKANLEIQMSFYKYLQDDSSNKFIRTLQNFLKSNFSQFKNYMKNNIGSQNSQGEEQKNFSQIMDSIQENCIQTMELIRLSCENHFSKMQDFLRVQIDSHNEIKTNSINVVTLLADIFEKYCKVLNESNLQFGLQILNTLIELIQGPCIENQNILCHTKLLENLEDLIADLNIKSKKFIGSIKNTRIFTRFSRKIFLLLRGLFDANEDPIIISKISNYVDPQMLIQKMNFTYKQYLMITSKISSKHQGLIQFLSIMKDETKKQQLLLKQDKAEEDEEGDDSSVQKNDKLLTQKLTKKNDMNGYNLSNQYNASNIPHKKKQTIKQQQYSSDVITYMRGDELINEGFDAYILLKNLCFLDPSFNKRYNYYLQNIEIQEDKYKEIRQTLNFYKLNTCSIEIVNSKGNIQKIIFRIPKLMKYFSTTSQEYFMDNCERGSAQEKVSSLLDNLNDFHEEMKHFLYLNSKNLFFNLTYLSYFRNLNLFVILIINLFILYEWDQKKDISDDQTEEITLEVNQDAKNFKTFIQIMQLIMSCLIYVIWLIFQFPLELKKSISNFNEYEEKTFKYKANNQNDIRQQSDAQRKITKLNRAFRRFIYIANHLVLESHFIYLLIAIIFSILGITSNPVFFCLLLLDIIDRSVVLRNVIKSITLNALSLIMTAILGIIIVYIYTMIGFYTPSLKNEFKFAGNNDKMEVCTDQIDCFLFFLNFGLRNGGGIGDSFVSLKDDNPSYTDLFFFEVSFFVVIIIMILNVVFGIIIDTFAELRDMKNFKDNDQKNNCFICNIQRSSFENERINFKKHSQKEHNCWNYLAYIIMLDYKDSNEYDGIEYYVSEKIQKQDMSWFPIGKSLTLQAERQKKNQQGIDQISLLKSNKQQDNLFK